VNEFPPLRLADGEHALVRFLEPHPQGFLARRLSGPQSEPEGEPILVRTTTRYAADGHADYPHEPGTLYDCAPCERLMQEEDMRLDNHGLARRIAANWHSPGGDGFSHLSHTGEIIEEVIGAVAGAIHVLKGSHGRAHLADDPYALVDMRWLQRYVEKRGVGKYEGKAPWSRMWDESHAGEPAEA
jgi:hypothetical protein